jgi:hypothetical protein
MNDMQELTRLVLLDYWQKTDTIAKLRGQRTAVSWEAAQDRLMPAAAEYIAKCKEHGINPLHNSERVMQRAVLLGHLHLPLLNVLGVTTDGADSFCEKLRSVIKERIMANLVKVTGASENIRVVFGDAAWTGTMVNETLKGMLDDPVVYASYCDVSPDNVTDQAKIAFLRAPDLYSKMLAGVLNVAFSNMVATDV